MNKFNPNLLKGEKLDDGIKIIKEKGFFTEIYNSGEMISQQVRSNTVVIFQKKGIIKEAVFFF